MKIKQRLSTKVIKDGDDTYIFRNGVCTVPGNTKMYGKPMVITYTEFLENLPRIWQ